jgi:hypothetical protein
VFVNGVLRETPVAIAITACWQGVSSFPIAKIECVFL